MSCHVLRVHWGACHSGVLVTGLVLGQLVALLPQPDQVHTVTDSSSSPDAATAPVMMCGYLRRIQAANMPPGYKNTQTTTPMRTPAKPYGLNTRYSSVSTTTGAGGYQHTT
jgi:hypothetical protein